MGCCGGSTISDREIKYAVNYKELISIMKNKRNNLGKEKNQIEEYLKDKTKEITLIRVTALDDEQLRKRLPYLDKLSQVYSEVIKLMEDCFVLPFKETKEHLYNIVFHHMVYYNDEKEIDRSFEEFKKFYYKYKK